MQEGERKALERFFTNADESVFALRAMPKALQNYLYMGVSRFPGLRERFIKLLKGKGAWKKTLEALGEESRMESALQPVAGFAAEKNRAVFFEYGHKSAGEGASVFIASEKNPIYATEEQQDFYFPLTTMEFSTRYATKFSADRIHWDPELEKAGFLDEAKRAAERNLELYERGFDALKERVQGKGEGGELPEKVSVLDSLRFLIPLAAHTSLIVGGNARAMLEHLRKLLASRDSFVKQYAGDCIWEAQKLFPEYFSGVEPDKGVLQREERLGEYAGGVFGKRFSQVKENVKIFLDLPSEELAMAQLLYPHCSATFQEVFERVSSFKEKEREGLFRAAEQGRESKAGPATGLETRPIVFEIEAPWALWKDFKRHRMNLRFHQQMRGKAGFGVPELVKGSALEKDYKDAMGKTSSLVERVFEEQGSLSRAVAAQGCRKRFLLCMGAKQLTGLAELRTSGEGDKGYRRIASKMIELAKGEKPGLFGHIRDNFKESA